MSNLYFYFVSGIGYNLFFLGFLVLSFIIACFRTKGWLIPFAIGVVFQMVYLLVMLRIVSPYAESFALNGLIIGVLLSVFLALLGALLCNSIYKSRTAKANAIRKAALEKAEATAAQTGTIHEADASDKLPAEEYRE